MTSTNHFWRTDGSFACIECMGRDMMAYRETNYEVECTRCGITYKIRDVSHGDKLWVCPPVIGLGDTRTAMRLDELTNEQLNDAIALLILEPDRHKGFLEPLVTELERRRH